VGADHPHSLALSHPLTLTLTLTFTSLSHSPSPLSPFLSHLSSDAFLRTSPSILSDLRSGTCFCVCLALSVCLPDTKAIHSPLPVMQLNMFSSLLGKALRISARVALLMRSDRSVE